MSKPFEGANLTEGVYYIQNLDTMQNLSLPNAVDGAPIRSAAVSLTSTAQKVSHLSFGYYFNLLIAVVVAVDGEEDRGQPLHLPERSIPGVVRQHRQPRERRHAGFREENRCPVPHQADGNAGTVPV